MRVQKIQDQLKKEVERTAAESNHLDRKRKELKDRIDRAADEGERRRLMGQLDQVDREWRDRLAQENETQHKKLKAALEERRRAKKKLKDELANKRQEKMTEAAANSLDGILDTDEVRAAEDAKAIVDKID